MADKTTGKLELWLAKITDKISDTINIYLSENFSKIDDEFSSLKDGVDEHKAESAIHKTSDVIRTETNTQLKVEVVSSSVSETPDAGRIIFDTSQGKFFGGNGTEWV